MVHLMKICLMELLPPLVMHPACQQRYIGICLDLGEGSRCISLQIIGGQVSSRSAATNTTTFDLTLAQEVTVTESFYPAFSPLNFVTVTGGALGLWLGVGVVQVLSYVASAASWLTVQRHGRNKLS